LKRRAFLGILAVTVISASQETSSQAATVKGSTEALKGGQSRSLWGTLTKKVPIPKVIFQLPKGNKKSIAWTIDDGASVSTVAEYIKLAKQEDLRLTFFVISAFASWRKNAKQLKPLVESGQIQLANHTKTHINLVQASDARIRSELLDCERFIMKVYGVDPKPYFRPPYGYYDDRVLRIAAELGYTKPVMWFGVLADSAATSSYRILSHAKQWLVGGRIVIDHANSKNTVADFSTVVKTIRSRGLKTVTLNDVWSTDPGAQTETAGQVKDYFFNGPERR
jgi:peptidoglycan/xylan/chitin deacetylase (PgdA/CDA1 family)